MDAKATKGGPLITIDEAVRRAQEAGFPNMIRRWWERKIAAGVLTVHEGAVPYLSSAEVDLLIKTMLEVKGET